MKLRKLACRRRTAQDLLAENKLIQVSNHALKTGRGWHGVGLAAGVHGDRRKPHCINA
jgi:hypothetical protein